MTDCGESVLLLDAPFGSGASDCLDRVLADRPRSVLVVSYDTPADECVTALRRRSERIDSAAAVAVGPGNDGVAHDSVRAVSDPADLTGVGIAVTEWLDDRIRDESPVVCLDSLSAMLQYAHEKRVFEFLHAVTGQCRQRDAGFHAHLTPSAHDEQTLATFRVLFDECDDRRDATATDAGGTQVATDGGRETR
jgi:hypothetical protein